MLDLHPSDFKEHPFLHKLHHFKKSNLESMLESVLLAQQKQDEYIKQLASKVDLLITHNKMLEAQIG